VILNACDLNFSERLKGDAEIVSWLDSIVTHYALLLKDKKIWRKQGVIVVPLGETFYFKESLKIPAIIASGYSNAKALVKFSEFSPSDTLYFEERTASSNTLLDYIEIPTLYNWAELGLCKLEEFAALEVLKNYTSLVEFNAGLTNYQTLKIAKALQ
jgi:hypothetical protein